MKIAIDTDARTLTVEEDGGARTLDLWGVEAFELISDLWLRTSWNAKYPYTFTWLDRPIIQHPEDIGRRPDLRPDVLNLVFEQIEDLPLSGIVKLEVPDLHFLVLTVAMDPTDPLFEPVGIPR